MLRNCIIAIVVLIALAAGYGWWLMPQFEPPLRYVIPLVMAGVVWFGLVNFSGAFYSIRDWRARNRLARGERPRDGDLTSAVGPLRATLGTISAPFSDRECVYYKYDIGPDSGASTSGKKELIGLALARCAVQTPFGEFNVGMFPVAEGFPEEMGDRSIAEDFIEKTRFEEISILDLAKKTFGAHRQPPPIRYDWQFGDRTFQIDSAEIKEQVISPGEVVTVIGRYDAKTNSLVSDEEMGFLRIKPGGEARRVEVFPWKAFGQFVFGIAVIAIANAVLWRGLQELAQR